MLLWSFYNFMFVSAMVLSFCLENWLMIWVLIELVTMLVMSLVGTKTSPRVVEGMSKYYITQAVASAVLLLGILWHFSMSGSLSVFSEYSSYSYGLILVGLFIKLAAFPNPFWFIDVISGVGLLRGFYVVMMSKVIPVYLYMKISGAFKNFLLCVGLVTAAMGSVCGMKQTNVRKIIAFSSVAHLGWLLLGFPSLSGEYCAFVFLCYVVMVFPIVWLCGYYEMKDLSKVKRCYFQPWFLFVLIVALLSLGGFPPLLGFVYKWVMFQGLLGEGALLLCGYLMFMSLLSLFFYLRLCYLLYSVYWPEDKVVLFSSFLCGLESKSVVWIFIIIQVLMMLVGIFCLGLIEGL